MQKIHHSILAIDQELSECDQKMDNELPEKINQAQIRKQEGEERLDSLNEQLEAFIIGENEVINQIENFLERKKEQIIHETHDLY